MASLADGELYALDRVINSVSYLSNHRAANPFAKRETINLQAVWTYKILTLGTWLLAVLVSIYYTFGIPDDVREHGGNTIWDQNKTHPTPFALNALIASLYW